MNGKAFIPGIVPVLLRPYSARIFVKAYNLKKHPETQTPRTKIDFEVENMYGQRKSLTNIFLLGMPEQAAPGEYELLFQADFSEFESGPYVLHLLFADGLAEKKKSSKALFILQ